MGQPLPSYDRTMLLTLPSSENWGWDPRPNITRCSVLGFCSPFFRLRAETPTRGLPTKDRQRREAGDPTHGKSNPFRDNPLNKACVLPVQFSHSVLPFTRTAKHTLPNGRVVVQLVRVDGTTSLFYHSTLLTFKGIATSTFAGFRGLGFEGLRV